MEFKNIFSSFFNKATISNNDCDRYKVITQVCSTIFLSRFSHFPWRKLMNYSIIHSLVWCIFQWHHTNNDIRCSLHKFHLESSHFVWRRERKRREEDTHEKVVRLKTLLASAWKCFFLHFILQYSTIVYCNKFSVIVYSHVDIYIQQNIVKRREEKSAHQPYASVSTLILLLLLKLYFQLDSEACYNALFMIINMTCFNMETINYKAFIIHCTYTYHIATAATITTTHPKSIPHVELYASSSSPTTSFVAIWLVFWWNEVGGFLVW